MPEADKLILIAVGPDHVGLVQKISEFIVNRGGNIVVSRGFRNASDLVGGFEWPAPPRRPSRKARRRRRRRRREEGRSAPPCP